MLKWFKNIWEMHKAKMRVKRLVNSGKLALDYNELQDPLIKDCPICEEKKVYVDIPIHGPGIDVMDFECGCKAVFRVGEPTKYIRHDGEVFKENKNDE